MSTLTLDSIVIGDRVRKDMGDLAGLAESMRAVGLLQPVGVLTDHTLVFGHRRLTAARRLGWTEIPVIVFDLDNPLVAERDENAQRKALTPTEAAALGRLIEARERPKALERKRQSAARMRAKGRGEPLADETSASMPRGAGDVRAIAAQAVGMSPSTYGKAKAVVEAAEADPATFGDLSAQMDETGNVASTYRELRERQGRPVPKRKPAPPPERLPINYKKHRVKPNDVVRKTCWALDGLCAGLERLDPGEIDAAERPKWAQELTEAARRLRAFGRRLDHDQA